MVNPLFVTYGDLSLNNEKELKMLKNCLLWQTQSHEKVRLESYCQESVT